MKNAAWRFSRDVYLKSGLHWINMRWQMKNKQSRAVQFVSLWIRHFDWIWAVLQCSWCLPLCSSQYRGLFFISSNPSPLWRIAPSIHSIPITCHLVSSLLFLPLSYPSPSILFSSFSSILTAWGRPKRKASHQPQKPLQRSLPLWPLCRKSLKVCYDQFHICTHSRHPSLPFSFCLYSSVLSHFPIYFFSFFCCVSFCLSHHYDALLFPRLFSECFPLALRLLSCLFFTSFLCHNSVASSWLPNSLHSTLPLTSHHNNPFLSVILLFSPLFPSSDSLVLFLSLTPVPSSPSLFSLSLHHPFCPLLFPPTAPLNLTAAQSATAAGMGNEEKIDNAIQTIMRWLRRHFSHTESHIIYAGFSLFHSSSCNFSTSFLFLFICSPPLLRIISFPSFLPLSLYPPPSLPPFSSYFSFVSLSPPPPPSSLSLLPLPAQISH